MYKFTTSLMCLLAASLLAGAATAPATPAPAPAPGTAPAKLTVTGAIRTGIMAIGGETTGTEIVQGATKYELDIKDAALKKKAEDLNGKQATVTGTLTVKQGVETGQRRIIAVDTLEAAKP